MTVYVSNRLATKNEIVKILGRGELKAKLKVTAHKFTATAKAAIEAAVIYNYFEYEILLNQ
jgi:large subunit ribosomal protein L15